VKQGEISHNLAKAKNKKRGRALCVKVFFLHFCHTLKLKGITRKERPAKNAPPSIKKVRPIY
jgi:hypothetical protein